MRMGGVLDGWKSLRVQNGEVRIALELCTHSHIINESTGPDMSPLTGVNG